MNAVEKGVQLNATAFGIAANEQNGRYICDLPRSLFVDGSNIKMGDRLVFGVAGVNKQFDARLVGAVAEKHVMLIVDDENLDLSRFLIGLDIYCCHVSNESFHTFKSKVIESSLSPFPYLIIDYPKEIKRLSAKRDVRFDVDLVALLHKPIGKEGKEKLVTAKLINLGGGGVLATTIEPVAMVGDEIEISVSLPCADVRVDLKLKSRVKTVNDEVDAKGQVIFRYGMQFIDVKPRENMCLKSYLFDLLQKDATQNKQNLMF